MIEYLSKIQRVNLGSMWGRILLMFSSKNAISQKGKLFMCFSSQFPLSASRINSSMMDYLAFFLSALEIPAFAQMMSRRNMVALTSFKRISTSQVKEGKFSHCVNERCPETLSRWLYMMFRLKVNLQIHSSSISFHANHLRVVGLKCQAQKTIQLPIG